MEPIEAIVFEPECCFGRAGDLYEDVIPALTELRAMGIRLFVAGGSSHSALNDFFPAEWAGENSARTIYLTGSGEGIDAARALGVHPVLMMNDPDEAMRLTARNPAGGIVSLGELPDFIRLVAAENGI
jgi:hypothetical protein